MNRKRTRVAILTNMIAPARIPLFSGLADHFEVVVLHGGTESNRDSWKETGTESRKFTGIKAWGWQIRTARREKGRIFDKLHFHVTPGYVWHLLRINPDVIASTEMGLRTLIALAYGALFGKPVWVWWGGTCHTERNIGFMRVAVRFLISKWAHHWISYGESSTEYLLTLGIPRASILQIQNAVDELRFLTPTKPQLDMQVRPVLLHVGQLIARKGVDALLRAAAVLQREGYRFSLLLVGDGPGREDLCRLTVDLGLQNVFFVPALPPETMPAVYRSADVLVFPTLEDVWGLVANEAVLSGLTVLCSKYAGCAQELFSPQSVFDPENPADFISKLREALCGRMPAPDPARLLTTPQIVRSLTEAFEGSRDQRKRDRSYRASTSNLRAAKL
jgi:glycosyltransferase involved in cell wall biosynthesis